jgi:broad-specificity NMP kinase
MKNIILVNGTMGIGKTSVCKELQKILSRNVFLDGDWCWCANPFIVTEETKAMALRNITYLLNSFIACSEYENIIFCWVMHTQEILDAVCGALNFDGRKTYKFTLTATEKSLIERLSADIAAHIREPGIIERAVERLPLYEAVDTIKIDVSAITARQAAKLIDEKISMALPKGTKNLCGFYG